MLKEKIKRKFDDSFTTFEDYQSNLTSGRYSGTPIIETGSKFADLTLNGIKQIFLFFPGAFILYFATIFLSDIFFIQKLNILHFTQGFLWLFISSFMVIFGIGNIRNPKHLLIPGSIIAFSFLVFSASLLMPHPFRLEFITFHSVNLFPIALILPFLAKGLAGNKH